MADLAAELYHAKLDFLTWYENRFGAPDEWTTMAVTLFLHGRSMQVVWHAVMWEENLEELDVKFALEWNPNTRRIVEVFVDRNLDENLTAEANRAACPKGFDDHVLTRIRQGRS